VNFNASDLLHVAAPMAIIFFAVTALLVDAFARKGLDRSFAGYIVLLGLLFAAALEALAWTHSPALGKPLFGGTITHDRFSILFNFVFIGVAASAVMQGIGYFKERHFAHGEFYALLMSSLLGLVFLVMAADLLTLYVGLELASISTYILTGFERHRLKSAEAALKYFFMGAFSSAFLLFGLALLYGACGDTSYAALYKAVKTASESGLSVSAHPALFLGTLFAVVGFGFKTAAVPFHMWAPDAYDGAPTPSSSFMAAAIKAGAFAALFRLLTGALPGLYASASGWGTALWVLAILTMVFGNLFALTQDNIKRLLAYSSIAHAGYLLTALVAGGNPSARADAAALPFYLAVYALSTVGVFAVVIRLGRREDENLIISKGYSGLGYADPLSGAAMTIFLLAFAGFPPTAGFIAKFYAFRAAVDAGFIELAIIGVLASLLSVYYYARVIVYLYMKPEPDAPHRTLTTSLPVAFIIAISAVLVILLGIIPDLLLEPCRLAAAEFFRFAWLGVGG